MPQLTGKDRARLPDSAFAYVDSKGDRRLPINDESHVRNALSRFNQVGFEDSAAREKARAKVLKAAKRFGIVPVGFITAQLQATSGTASLPAGIVTLLMTDIEGSTRLLHRIGAQWPLLTAVQRILRAATRRGKDIIDERADEFFAAFRSAAAAVSAAAEVQRALARKRWADGVTVRVRAGLHSGKPNRTALGYIGLPVHTVARVCSAAKGGQIILTGETLAFLKAHPPADVSFTRIGRRSRAFPNPPSCTPRPPNERGRYDSVTNASRRHGGAARLVPLLQYRRQPVCS
jgi:class 3 adenylate cyclase